MTTPEKIAGIYTPNIVPFHADHTINEGELRRMTSWLIEKGRRVQDGGQARE
jgi:4-hydroxy-tetrahydrodipicolinate synthase